MPIPKVIYQTWKTKNLHPNVQKVRDNIQRLNPSYEMKLFDDAEMDSFIKENYSDEIYECYNNLLMGAAKADFWRYCVLYINGGIYLDIDSNITGSLDDLIVGDESCIITREKNPGIFNNWILIYEKRHPVLLNTILNCVYNIIYKTTNDILCLTGPVALTNAINHSLTHIYDRTKILYYESDGDLNAVLNKPNSRIRARFYGYDMEAFAQFKHDQCVFLYTNHIHWKNEQNIFKY